MLKIDLGQIILIGNWLKSGNAISKLNIIKSQKNPVYLSNIIQNHILYDFGQDPTNISGIKNARQFWREYCLPPPYQFATGTNID